MEMTFLLFAWIFGGIYNFITYICVILHIWEKEPGINWCTNGVFGGLAVILHVHLHFQDPNPFFQQHFQEFPRITLSGIWKFQAIYSAEADDVWKVNDKCSCGEKSVMEV